MLALVKMKAETYPMNVSKHLIEVGFMGAGKTTVGRAVAERLSVPFYDSDAWVERESGITIPEIFAGQGGEHEFRVRERDALLAILEEEPGIVSTGGGIVSTGLGRRALLGCEAPVVWLELDFATTKQRVEADTANVRPLFENPQIAHGLFIERQPWYEEVSTAIVIASQPISRVVEEVVGYIE